MSDHGSSSNSRHASCPPSASEDAELAFVPSRVWELTSALLHTNPSEDDEADSPIDFSAGTALRFHLEPSTHGAVGEAVPTSNDRCTTDLVVAPEALLLDTEKKRLEAERKAKRKELLSRTVYVRGLPASMPQADFAAMLLDCGPYNRVRVCGNAPEGQNYLYGFVEFATTLGAERMMAKSGTELKNGTERAPLRLDCTRVKRPIMDTVAEDADLERGTPCSFGLPRKQDEGRVWTLGDVLHVVPPNVQAKAALRKGIDRCACGCDGDSCCACCRCFSKQTNKASSEVTNSGGDGHSCCDGNPERTTARTRSDEPAGSCHSSHAEEEDRAPVAFDYEVALSQRQEQLAACTALLPEVLEEQKGSRSRVACDAFSQLCVSLRVQEAERRSSSDAEPKATREDWRRLELFTLIVAAALHVFVRRTAAALPFFAEIEALLKTDQLRVGTVELRDYATNMACLAAMCVEGIDVDWALRFYRAAQTVNASAGGSTRQLSQATERESRNEERGTCLALLCANLAEDGVCVPPEDNPAWSRLFSLLQGFLTGVPSEVRVALGDSVAFSHWILTQVCDWQWKAAHLGDD